MRYRNSRLLIYIYSQYIRSRRQTDATLQQKRDRQHGRLKMKETFTFSVEKYVFICLGYYCQRFYNKKR